MAEVDCGKRHLSIEDAIHHARQNLGGVADVDPVWGGMGIVNTGRVVGYQVSARKRWRLDFDPRKGVHVNEENFLLSSNQKVVHRVEPSSTDESGTPVFNDIQVRLFWNKWTTRYGVPGNGTWCSKCENWHLNGKCPF